MGCGDQVYGTDFIDLHPQREEVIKCDFTKEAFPFPTGTFDEVYSENLFEHMVNPNQALKEMVRVLKIDGKLVLITDNASFWAFHLGAKTHYGGYEERIGNDDDRHYALYTTWHLINHFEKLGLKDIKTEYLLVKEKHSKKLPVKIVTNLLLRFWPHLGSPQIKVSGVKK